MTNLPSKRSHSAHSFIFTDADQLVEFCACQGTFNGAYTQTALGNLGYSLAMIGLFDCRFCHSTLIVYFLAVILCVCAFLRGRHSRHDFADYHDYDTASS
ncbi:hypothetical protein H4582DRAFT_1806112 [Lactarius indigo]|nr:hypothetical protein H4582DRAFT_1806112 [Lactarius indigo]